MKFRLLFLLLALIMGGCTTPPKPPADPFAGLRSEDNARRQEARTALKESFARATAPGADGAAAVALEAEVIARLDSALPLSERLYLVRLLEWFGGEASVGPLADLAQSDDPQLRDSALRGLSSLPEAAAGEALLDLLRRSGTESRRQVLDTLVYRQESAGIDAMIEALDSSDPGLVEAAALALGKLKASRSVAALQAARSRASGAVGTVIEGALLEIGVGSELAAELAATGSNGAIRVAAYKTLLAQDPQRAERVLLEAFRNPEFPGRTRMLREAVLEGSDTVRRDLVRALPTMAPGDQVTIAEAIGAARLAEFERDLVALVPGAEGMLQTSLVTVLSGIGGDESYAALYAAFAASSEDPVLAEAVASLRAPSADRSALAGARAGGDPADRVAAIRVLALRNSEGATELLNDIISTPGEASVREEAMRALESIGNLESARRLAKLVLDQDPLKRRAQVSLKRLSIRFDAPDALWEEAYAPQLDRASSDDERADLMAILDGVPCDAALAYLSPYVADSETALHDAAMRVLERWALPNAGDLWIDHVLDGKPDEDTIARAQVALIRLLSSKAVGGAEKDKIALAVRAVQEAPSVGFKRAIVQSYERDLSGRERRLMEEIFAPIIDDPDVGDLVRAVLPR